jgi:hypothetical protein
LSFHRLSNEDKQSPLESRQRYLDLLRLSIGLR